VTVLKKRVQSLSKPPHRAPFNTALFFLLGLLLIFPVLVKCEPFKPPAEGSGRALFVSLIQNPPTLSNREAIVQLVDFSKKAHVKVLFVQIYRANQAWFPSQVGDTASYEAALKALGEDPFAFLVREAHEAGIEVHAWLNLLSLSTNENAPLLKSTGRIS